MGILRGRRDDDGDVRRFQMRQKMISIGDDYWIEDDDGNARFESTAKPRAFAIHGRSRTRAVER